MGTSPFNMLPRFASEYFSDASLVNAEHCSDLTLQKISGAIKRHYLSNIKAGKFVIWGLLAFCVSAFLVHVCIIIQNRTEPKMLGIDAGRIIPARAIMENAHSIGDRSIKQYPRSSMSFKMTRPMPAHADMPITFFVSVSNPDPATISNGNILPKSLVESFRESPRCEKLFGDCLPAWMKFEKLGLHNQDSFVCATLPAAQTARGHFNNTGRIGGVNAGY